MDDKQPATVSSGNVFADLMIDEPDVAIAKAELVRKLSQIIDEKGWTQARAAAALDIDQPELSTLLQGVLDRFSLDSFFRFLNALDHNVSVVISARKTIPTNALVSASAEMQTRRGH